MIVVGISGYADAELLAGAVESVPKHWPIVYCDGRVSDFPSPGKTAEWGATLRPGDACIGFGVVQWVDEAQKKSAICREAHRLHMSTMGKHSSDGWLLLLDTDERLEFGDGPEPKPWKFAAYIHAGMMQSRMPSSGPPQRDWFMVNIYRPDQPTFPEGFPIPRLVRLTAETNYRGPHDLHAYIGDQRIAYLDGEPVPPEQANRWATVPRDILRIRHDRHLRSAERLALNGEYQRVRRARTGH